MANPRLATETAPPAALVNAVAFHGVRAQLGPILTEPLSDVCWAALLAEAAGRRLSGFLVAAMKAESFAATPSQWESAERTHAQALHWCMRLEHCLLRVSGLLSQAGIEHRVLKGPAMAHLVYRPPSIRTFVDIDLRGRRSYLRWCGRGAWSAVAGRLEPGG